MKVANVVKSLLSVALLTLGSSAMAAAHTVTVTHVGGVLGNAWSSVCVANVGLKSDVTAQYRYGDEGEWEAVKIEKDTIVRFSQEFANDGQPLKFTLKFVANAHGQELSHDLDETETRLEPVTCNRVENYKFQTTDTDDGSIDLVKVQ